MSKPQQNCPYMELSNHVLSLAGWLQKKQLAVLKKRSISFQQYTVLSILKSLHPKKASVKIIKEQMRHDNSNVSRLIETLKLKGLVIRETNKNDRRAVDVSLTTRGLKIIKAAIKDIGQLNKTIIKTTPIETKHINKLLNEVQGDA